MDMPSLGDAKPVKDNPTGVGYVAKFVADSTSSVSGDIFVVSDAMGIGTNFHATLNGLPKGMGPFSEQLYCCSAMYPDGDVRK
jgi:hypothetical protein